MKLPQAEIDKLDQDELLKFDVSLPKGATTTMIFRKPTFTDVSGPWRVMAEKDAHEAMCVMLKTCCLSHDGEELQAVWNVRMSAFRGPSDAFARTMSEGTVERKNA
jgi:hypothetical protein